MNKLILGSLGVLSVMGISAITYTMGIRDGIKMSNQVLNETADDRRSRYRSRGGVNYIPYTSHRRSREVEVLPKEYTMDHMKDAEDVLSQLKDHADKYAKVSVADYYDLIGEQSTFKDHSYGWTSETINQAYVIVSNVQGYTIKFPPVEVI